MSSPEDIDAGYISMLAEALTDKRGNKKAVRIFFDYMSHHYGISEDACRKYLDQAAEKAGLEVSGRSDEMANLRLK